MEKKVVINSLISVGSKSEILNRILSKAGLHESAYVCAVNVHMSIIAYYDESFRKIINQADFSIPDGVPIAKMILLIHGIKQQRIAGMDIFPELINEAMINNFSVYFLGSTDEVLNKIRSKIEVEFPKLRIAGMYSPPFRELSFEEQNDISKKIEESHPNFVFVSLGCPKQEIWMAQNKGKINATMIGVGNAFKTFINEEKRLPASLQKFGIEWLFRLFQEPKRLWKRYLFSNSVFIILSIRQIISHRFLRQN